MSHNSCRDQSCGYEPSSKARALYEIVHEHRCPLDLLSTLAPSEPEEATQLVMDRLLRQYLKRKPPQ
jgi:hypothetical protein